MTLNQKAFVIVAGFFKMKNMVEWIGEGGKPRGLFLAFSEYNGPDEFGKSLEAGKVLFERYEAVTPLGNVSIFLAL